MLDHLNIENLNLPADSLCVDSSMGAELVLDPPYQRGSVWTAEQRINLIKSMLQGLPIGSIFINERSIDDPHYYVIDGKQRIETIRDFRTDLFSVPIEWVKVQEDVSTIARLTAQDIGGPAVAFYSELASRSRILVDNAIVSTYRTRLRTEAEELDLFNRINYGGTPQEAR